MFSLLPPDERRIDRLELRQYTTTSVKTWIGGYRNRPEEWTEPRNWFPHGVPTWRDRVTVGGYSRHRCNVATGVDPVASLAILIGATVVVAEHASLAIDGTFTDPMGLLGGSGIHIEGSLHVKGDLTIRHSTGGGIVNSGIIVNRGRLRVDESVTDCPLRWGHLTNLGQTEYLA